ncbi:MAG: orotate phosphoribosyltransferase, partial [Bacteroidota bacterium]
MQSTENTSAKIAEYLLDIRAINLKPDEPYTWTSGWKSPIYSDNRLSLSYPHVRQFIKEQLGELIKSQFSSAEAIVGVATAGIAPGVLAA